jgi:hypothetical protein
MIGLDLRPVEQPLDVLEVGGIAAHDAVVAADPDVAERRDDVDHRLGQIVRVAIRIAGLRVEQVVDLGRQEAGQAKVEVQIAQLEQLVLEHFDVPARVERQLVVGEHVGLALGLVPAGAIDHRDMVRRDRLAGGRLDDVPLLVKLERGHEPTVPGDDLIGLAEKSARIGLVHPHSSIDALIWRTCSGECVRALFVWRQEGRREQVNLEDVRGGGLLIHVRLSGLEG